MDFSPYANLHDAIEYQDVDEFRVTVKSYGGSVQEMNVNGDSPLHLVCKRNYRSVKEQLQFAEVLVNEKANISSAYNKVMKTPIYYAYEYCNVNLMDYFLRHVGDDDVETLINEFQVHYQPFLTTPKLFDDRKSKADVYLEDFVAMIKKKSAFYKKFLIFYNTLLYANENHRLNKKNLLIAINSDIAKVSFYAAVYCNYFQLIKYLLDSGLDIGDERVFGCEIPFSALHVAFGHKVRFQDQMIKTVHILILFGANLTKKNKKLDTPLKHSVMIRQKNNHIIGSYLQLRKHLGQPCVNDNLESESRTLEKICEQEIDRLKKYKLHENFSLYCVLILDVSVLSKNLENNIYLFHGLSATDIMNRYRYFGKFIVMKIILAHERYRYIFCARPFLKYLNKRFANILGMHYFPTETFSMIENYLSSADLFLLRDKSERPRLCCLSSRNNTCIIHANYLKF